MNLSEALDHAQAHMLRFTKYPNPQIVDAVTLIVAGTHAVDSEHMLVFETFPRLFIGSIEPSSGKTTAQNVIAPMLHNGMPLVQPTASSITAMINQDHATICIDEIDRYFGKGGGHAHALALLNAGYKIGAQTSDATKGVQNLYAPLVMTGLSQTFSTHPNLATLYERSICVHLRKQSGNASAEEYRTRIHASKGAQIGKVLSRLIAPLARELAIADPEMPDGVYNRDRELWEPLIALADAAGNGWPERARAACRRAVLEEVDDLTAAMEESDHITPDQQIVNGLTRVFGSDEDGPTELRTLDLIDGLAAMPEHREFASMKPRTAAMEIAAALATFDVEHVKVWLPEEQRSAWGYRRADVVKHATVTVEDAHDDVLAF